MKSRVSVKFPIGQPLPLDLITRIVQFRVNENLQKAAAKANKKGCDRTASGDLIADDIMGAGLSWSGVVHGGG